MHSSPDGRRTPDLRVGRPPWCGIADLTFWRKEVGHRVSHSLGTASSVSWLLAWWKTQSLFVNKVQKFFGALFVGILRV